MDLYVTLTDTHIGKTKSPERRLKRLFDGLPCGDFERVILLLVGDMIEGEGIFPTQPYVVGAMPAIDQLELAVRLFGDFADDMAAYYGECEIYGVRGNHGRTGKDRCPDTNWDHLLYWHLADRFRDSDCINASQLYERHETYAIPRSPVMMRHIGPKHAGTPAMTSRAMGWLTQYKRRVLVSGHWHKIAYAEHNGFAVIHGGSLCGGDEYSDGLALYDRAAQVWFTVSDGVVTGFGAVRVD